LDKVKIDKFANMKVLTFNVPDNLDLDNQQLAMLFASELYRQGRLSLGQAADVAGLTKRAFTELLGRYGVSVFNYPASDLSKDVANA
jgi:predicted HTH domain antitoxin